ncbi:DUF222 domain-containing protein [Aeromicrobium sp. CTD01-1L150]|uniref:HNH endonuclease signature motif containing protein n=1 Tax=Aeromicrobium sp. CTD01-1L150 TaxID=3341830 RepID=UPI0035BFB74A
MDTEQALDVTRLSDVVVARARAEAAEWAQMVSFRDAEMERIEALESSLERMIEKAGLVLSIGQAMGLSEQQVHAQLAVADRMRERAPISWLAFSDGRIDAARVRAIASALDRLEREESWLRLDQCVVAYASTHTCAELRAWLRRFVARTEPDLELQRAESAREDRFVEVIHVDDAMAWVNAYLPSHMAAAIAKRLVREARALGSGDERTTQQRMADLFVSWLTTSEATETQLTSDIAVTIEADVLTALADGLAEVADGSWSVPASWILDTALDGEAFWHRILKDPISHDVLAHEYVGRFSPEILAKAIAFRDGICRAPGCMRPADGCDLDHREPWPAGPTSGRNLWALCRRHHTMKGHQVLRWVLPTGQSVPAGTTEHTVSAAEASRHEFLLARLIIERQS